MAVAQRSLSLKVAADMYDQLSVVAERDEVSISHWVREAVRWALEEDAKPENATADEPERHTPRHVTEAMPRRIGQRMIMPIRRELGGRVL